MYTVQLTEDECEAILVALGSMAEEARAEWQEVYIGCKRKLFAVGYYNRLHDPENLSSKRMYESFIKE